MSEIKFQPGAIVSTPGVLDSVPPNIMAKDLRRHLTGDWGAVCNEDKKANNAAVAEGTRILSSYNINPNNPNEGQYWIITEWDRSVTTFLKRIVERA
jgi:hypothetical protein